MMILKKITAFIFLLFVGFLLSQNSVLAQNKKPNSIYDAPSRLLLPGDENEVREAENADLLREKFYPIGWSKDGKFAFYLEPADEACGCYFAELIIQDLRTDKILWKRDYNSSENAEVDLKSYWKKHQKEFSRKLAQYNIKAEKNFILLNPPIEYQKDVLTPEVKVNLKIDNEYSVEGNIILRLMSQNKGSKIIYEKNYKKSYDSIRNAEVSGVLLSPFEPRAAILLIETRRGWEGPPNITRVKIVGAALTNNFR